MSQRSSLSFSEAEARRLAVAAQAFGRRPAKPTLGHLRRLAAQIHAFQIDSVNVLARAHYVSPFARLGPYPVGALDALAYEKRELFEYWGHAACLLPVSLYPLLRYRMHTERTREHLRTRRGAYLARVYAEVAERGPMAAAELAKGGTRSGNWWGWSAGKRALETLYDAGLVAVAGRRGFERLYDIAERVIPQRAREAAAPPRDSAMKELICLAASAYGVATRDDLMGYFYLDGWRDRRTSPERRPKPVGKRLIAELVEAGRLVPVRVEGWTEEGYAAAGAKVPGAVVASAFVTPFDSLVWDRKRLRRLFGMDYTIEIYTPPAKRKYGYYVFPFLLGDAIVARCDLKADRDRRVLMVRSAHLEPGQKAGRVAAPMRRALEDLRTWLELDRIEIGRRGNLAPALHK